MRTFTWTLFAIVRELLIILTFIMPMTEVFQLVRAQYEGKPPPQEIFGPGHAKVRVCSES